MTERESTVGKGGNSVEGQKRQITEAHKEILKDGGHTHFLDCGAGFTGVHMCQTFQTVYSKCVQLCISTSINLFKYSIANFLFAKKKYKKII